MVRGRWTPARFAHTYSFDVYMTSCSRVLKTPPTVKMAASLTREFLYNNKDALLAGIIVAGWDEEDGPSVWTVMLGGALVQEECAIGGSGSTYIYGHVDGTWKPKMARDECAYFVTKALSHAMARDGSSGGVVRMVIVDKDSAVKRYISAHDLPFTL